MIKLVKGANAYADGFELFAKKLREAGVEGAEDLEETQEDITYQEKLATIVIMLCKHVLAKMVWKI